MEAKIAAGWVLNEAFCYILPKYQAKTAHYSDLHQENSACDRLRSGEPWDIRVHLEDNTSLLDVKTGSPGERKRAEPFPIGKIPARQVVTVEMPGILRLGRRKDGGSEPALQLRLDRLPMSVTVKGML